MPFGVKRAEKDCMGSGDVYTVYVNSRRGLVDRTYKNGLLHLGQRNFLKFAWHVNEVYDTLGKNRLFSVSAAVGSREMAARVEREKMRH